MKCAAWPLKNGGRSARVRFFSSLIGFFIAGVPFFSTRIGVFITSVVIWGAGRPVFIACIAFFSASGDFPQQKSPFQHRNRLLLCPPIGGFRWSSSQKRLNPIISRISRMVCAAFSCAFSLPRRAALETNASSAEMALIRLRIGSVKAIISTASCFFISP